MLPRECSTVLQQMLARYGSKIWTDYGFVDAFHPNGWVADDILGIDAGITLLMAENLRTGMVWREMMSIAEIPGAMDEIGLVTHES